MDTVIVVQFGMTLVIFILVSIVMVVVTIALADVMVVVICVMIYFKAIMEVVELELFMEDAKIYD